MTIALEYVASLVPGTKITAANGREYITCAEQEIYHVGRWYLFEVATGKICHASEVIDCTMSLANFMSLQRGDELSLLRRKVAHGCTDATCPECDRC